MATEDSAATYEKWASELLNIGNGVGHGAGVVADGAELQTAFAMTINKSQGRPSPMWACTYLRHAFRMGNFMLQCLMWGALMEFTRSSPTHSQTGASQPAVLRQQESLAMSTMHCKTSSQSTNKLRVGPPPKREVERNGAQRSVA
eukprot:359839-Chlamydomonas_euryale.AAC.8